MLQRSLVDLRKWTLFSGHFKKNWSSQCLKQRTAGLSVANSVLLQTDQNVSGTRQNQPPVTSQSSQEQTESAENRSPLVNQPNDPTEEIINATDSDDEEND